MAGRTDGEVHLLLKESEDDDSVTYRFGPGEERMGRLRFDKATREIDVLEPVPEPTEERYHESAWIKLPRVTRQGLDFPERAAYEA